MPELHDPTRESLSETVRALVKRHGGPTAVGEQVGAHRLTVNRWMKGDIGIDKLGLLAEKLEEPITVRFGPGHEETPPEPAWLEGLVREIRMNRAVIQAAMAGADPAFVSRVLDRLGALESRPTLSGGEAPDPIDAAT